MNKSLVRLGFILILLAFLEGLLIPKLANPRLGLSAHLGGLMAGTILVLLGMLSSTFQLSRGARTVMSWAWVFAAYSNWAGSFLGAATGAGRLTPLASPSPSGSPAAELAMAALLGIVAVASIVGTAIAVWGLRSDPGAP
jgi:hydroxylaminobenzene mutase